MKKIIILLIILALFISQAAAYAGEASYYIHNGDQVSIMNDMKVDKANAGNVVVIWGNLDVQDEVYGDVVCIMGNLTVNAKVNGQVVALFGKAQLTDKAEVRGDMVSIGTTDKDANAVIRGQTVDINFGSSGLLFIIGMIAVIFLFISFIIGIIIIAIFRKRFEDIILQSKDRLGIKLLTGFLGLIGLVIVSVILTVIGIGPLVFLVAVFVADITALTYIGRLVMKALNSGKNVFLEFSLGIIILTVVKIILISIIPAIGFLNVVVILFLVKIFIDSLGIGILIDTRFGSARIKPGSQDNEPVDTGKNDGVNSQ